MRDKLSLLYSWSVALLIFTLPSNLFFVLNESIGYVNGLRIDYLMPKFFLTDLIIFVILFLGYFIKKKVISQLCIKFFSKRNTLLLLCIGLLIIVQVFSVKPLISFFSVIKIIEFALLTLVLLINKELLNNFHIQISLVLSVISQVFIGSYQFLTQHSLTPFWITGESWLNNSIIGLARANFNGEERLLAYGTTPHPNILAGIVVLFSLLLLHNLKRRQVALQALILIATVWILFITQSWSAAFALVIGLGALFLQPFILRYFGQNVQTTLPTIGIIVFIFPLFLGIVSATWQSPSIVRRNSLNLASLSMITTDPLTGVGLGNFTADLEDYSPSKELVRFIQPVHNVGWLFLTETGVLGVIILWLIIRKVPPQGHNPLLFALLPLMVLDHYLVTIQPGILAGLFFIILSQTKQS